MIHVLAVRSILAAFLLCIPLGSIGTTSAAETEAGPSISLPATGPIPATRGQPRRYEMSVIVPIPSHRPDTVNKLEEPSSPMSAEQQALPEEETACRKALSQLGVFHTDEPSIAEPNGCHLPYPVVIDRLSRETELTPPARLNCATALALARLFTDKVPHIAQEHLGRSIRTVEHASAYVCRSRRSRKTLSEHAFGNAFDIGAFILSDGTRLTVTEKDDRESDGATFLETFRSAACGPFKTVLGPGTDADHADHFHLDLKQRRNETAYCR